MTNRAQLMASLRQRHSGPSAAPAAAPGPKQAHDPALTDFTRLPGYQQLAMGKRAAETLNLGDPFFRAIEAVEGTRVRIGQKWAENFASYDYLSLNRSEAVCRAVQQTVADWGVSSTASRLVGGDYTYHLELEAKMAAFLGHEAVLAMVSGHGTNQAILRTLVGPEDLIAVDSLAHNSIYEGIRLSGAAHVSFPHNDWAWLDRHLEEARHRYKRLVIVIEGLYSMDGDTPDLPRFVEIKHRHGGWLMVDEAHSIGTIGATGRGICEATGTDPREVDITMGTLSKTFCSAGGFIAGSAVLIDLMKHTAPGFVYSVGLSAPNSAAATAALTSLMADPAPARAVQALGKHFLEKARAAGLDCGPNEGHAIAPVIIGDSVRAVWVSGQLLEAGFNVLPIITPAVPDKAARLRFFLNAGHSTETIDRAIEVTAELVTRARALSF